MKPIVIRNINDLPEIDYTIVALGNFDGIHLGHQQLLKKIVEIKQKTNGKTVVFTFYPHPLKIIKQHNQAFIMQSFREKYEILCKFNVDYIFCARFTKEFAMMHPQSFVKKYMVDGLKAKEVCVGYNYTFGKLALGNTLTLKEYSKEFGFKLHIIPAYKIDNITVSSSKIRKFLKSGEVELANQFLGRLYSINGIVKKGKQRGKSLGFPTANIYFNRPLLLQEGVYAGFAKINDIFYKAAINVGSNPTFGDQIVHIEAYLIDFNGNLYNKRINLYFVKYIREEIKFDSKETLLEQIKSDVETIDLSCNKDTLSCAF
ncbi:Riboflavin kinase / FMN adenylyltransferase [Desulfurella amilsii]|uniref:Riboflavin biosynthesis protein n=1 Tax=Desulfurella amilsii TaxID=1562698 RepID=A0A1X4XZX2_9BACT|nr:bifunctional riboflavin kinase/FAD synthetase [Desulfurella amilsii]OSS43078.1 Riboflavin kinase / FMN adenylyltransferase [Desulfurella amilsii]